MNSRKPLAVDSSSLLQLKAELHRKKQESADRPAAASAPRGRLFPQRSARADIKRGDRRRARGNDNRVDGGDEEEDRELRRSRAILEEKSRLYSELSTDRAAGCSSETNKRFLVDFGSKARAHSDTTAPVDGQQWVHYVDKLGRSRTALQADVPAQYRHVTVPATCDEHLPGDDRQGEEGGQDVFERQKDEWKQCDADNAEKDSVHFEDVRFDEARTLGTGYFRFSRDESKRRAQREALESMRDETLAGQQTSQKAQSRQMLQMAQRLRKVRERKRLKLGLTIEDSLEREDEDAMKVTPVEHKESAVSAEQLAKEQEEREACAERKAFVREWDLGKEVWLKRAAKEPMTQKEWVTKQREHRYSEFAPPSFYQQQKAHSSSDTHPSTVRKHPVVSSDYVSHRNSSIDSSSTSAPRYHPGSSDCGYSSRVTVSFPPNLSHPPPSHPTSSCCTPPLSAVDGEEAANEVSSRAGVCVAPPATAEYHCAAKRVRPASWSRRSGPDSSAMDDAINAGLTLIRHQQDNSADRTADL